MKILVTGGTGFLGTALCNRLVSEGHDVVSLGSRDCDLRDPSSLDPYSERRFERIYHLAAWTQAGDFCLRHPGEQWIINQQINTHVLRWWQSNQAEAKLICMGTSCSYDPNLALREENYLIGSPIESLYTYAYSKRMLYVGLMALRKQFDLRYLHLVPSTLYGPGYHSDGRQMHFIFDLIRKILRAKLYEEPVVLWGDGHQRRELVFVDDFVSVLLRLDESCENETLNIGAGEEHSIRDFARMICDITEYDFERIQFDTSRYVGAKSKCLEVEKLTRVLPDLRLTPLQSGLSKTIEWFWEEREKLLPAPDEAGR